MSQRAGIWPGVLIAALLSLAWFGAMPYVPVDAWDAATNFTDPLTISPAQAYRFAQTATAALGGLPPDATLQASGGMSMKEFRGAGHRMSYGFTWYPRENALRFANVSDMAVAEVVSEPHMTCVRADCARYTVTYRPQLQFFIRSWHPAWWRAWLQARIRKSASFIAAPRDVRTSCPGGVDLAAFRRVVGNARAYLAYGGMGWPVPSYARELAIKGTTIARFPRSSIAQQHGTSIEAVEAIASDARPKVGRYRVVWLRVENPWPFERKGRGLVWLRFASDDLERTCNDALFKPSALAASFSDLVLAPGALVPDALYRSTEEARRRTHNAPHLRDARLISVVRTRGGTIVRTRHDDGTARWIGTFTYDGRGALLQAEYGRL